MEFDKSRVYTALNADELKPGDKVIVANTLKDLKSAVDTALYVYELTDILTESSEDRFFANDRCYLFAYLVERKENCTNCERLGKTCNSREDDKITCCFDYKPKTEQKAKPQYRPFKDVDELIKMWDAKYRYAYGLERINNGLTMPFIWVRRKGDPKDKGRLITAFNDVSVELGEAGSGDVLTMDVLFEVYEFLDGSPCGVKE